MLAAGDADAGETKVANIEQLPLYPEARACRRLTTEHILRLFSLAERVCVLNGAAVPRDAARDRYGDRNLVIVDDAGEDKLAPITERAGTKVCGIHAQRIVDGRQ